MRGRRVWIWVALGLLAVVGSIGGYLLVTAANDDAAYRFAQQSSKDEEHPDNYELAISQYEYYLREYPRGRHSEQAREKVEKEFPRRIEEREWTRASTADTSDAYNSYLKQFPEGKWALEARRRAQDTADRESRLWAAQLNEMAQEIAHDSHDFARVLSKAARVVRHGEAPRKDAQAPITYSLDVEPERAWYLRVGFGERRPPQDYIITLSVTASGTTEGPSRILEITPSTKLTLDTLGNFVFPPGSYRIVVLENKHVSGCYPTVLAVQFSSGIEAQTR